MTRTAQPGVHEFAATGPIDISLRMNSGDVTVTAVDEPVVVVALSPGAGGDWDAVEETVVAFEGNRLRVETPHTSGWRGFRRGRIRVSLSVPVNSTLSAHLGSADLRTDGPLATVTTRTGSGDVDIVETTGDLSAESGSGDVRCGRIGGALRTHTASGDISVAEVAGDTVAEAASGDVRLGLARGSVRASTASGDITIAAIHGGEAGIEAASGDISVGVPAGTAVWMDLVSMSGTTRNDLQVTGEPAGGASLRLRVQTMSGDIRIHRAAAV
jgi:hypothetical protein